MSRWTEILERFNLGDWANISFSNWYVLFGLFLPLSLLIWIWLRDRFPKLGYGSDRRIALPQDFGTAKSSKVLDFFLKCFVSSGVLMLAAAIIVWAGPQRLGVPKSERELTNIEFCLDLSGSMTARFGEGSRYDAAMAAINEFVKIRKGDAFGLTIFSDIAGHWIPLTTDPSAFQCATPFLDPKNDLPSGYGGGTMIGLGLKKCREILITRQDGDRMIILVSDGVSSDLNQGQDEVIAKLLAEDGIVLYSVHIGSGTSPPEVSAITNVTNGRSFSPQDTETLKEVFREIDSMEVAKMKRTYAEILDWFTPFSIAGLSFVMLSLLSVLGLRYSPW